MAFEKYKHSFDWSKKRFTQRFRFPVVRFSNRDGCLHLNRPAQHLLPIGKRVNLFFDKGLNRICIKPSVGFKATGRISGDGLSSARIALRGFLDYFEIDGSKIDGKHFHVNGEEGNPNAHFIHLNEPIEESPSPKTEAESKTNQ